MKEEEHMSDLIPYTEHGLTRDERRAARAVSRSRTRSQIRMAVIDDETNVAVDKIEAVTYATGTAMGAVTRVAQAQKQFETLAPEVSGRLSYLADGHMLAVGDTVQDLRRHLRCK